MKPNLQRLTPVSFAVICCLVLIAALPTSSAWGQEPVTRRGTAIEVRNVGNYTYLHIQEANDNYWIATGHAQVTTGASVSFHEQVWMYNFYSKMLNRTFDKVLFVGDVNIESSPPATAEQEPRLKGTPTQGQHD